MYIFEVLSEVYVKGNVTFTLTSYRAFYCITHMPSLHTVEMFNNNQYQYKNNHLKMGNMSDSSIVVCIKHISDTGH
jgi:hypothetical protein